MKVPSWLERLLISALLIGLAFYDHSKGALFVAGFEAALGCVGLLSIAFINR